jgi:phage I-like protein
MEFKDVLKHEIEQRKVAMDYHNNDLVAEVNRFIADDKLKGMMTDLEWLDQIAAIVNQREFRWGVTDCATGLTYSQDK